MDPITLTLMIVGGIVSIATTAYSLNSAQEQNMADKEWSSQEAEENRNFQRTERLEAQEYQTTERLETQKYNSIGEELKRAEEAGVSANALISGRYSSAQSYAMSSSGSSGSMAQLPQGILPLFGNLSGAIMNPITEMVKGISQAEKTNVETKYDRKSMPQRLEKLNHDVRSARAFADLTEAQQEGVLQTNEWISSHKSAELKEINQRVKLLEAQEATEKERKELVDAQTYTEISKDGLLEEQIAGQELQNQIAGEDFEQKKLQNEFSKITGIPFGTPEFEFAWWLYQQDEFENYCLMLAGEAASSHGTTAALEFINNILTMFSRKKINPNRGSRTITTRTAPGATTVTTESTTIPI